MTAPSAHATAAAAAAAACPPFEREVLVPELAVVDDGEGCTARIVPGAASTFDSQARDSVTRDVLEGGVSVAYRR